MLASSGSLLPGFGCAPDEPNVLDQLGTVSMTINEQTLQLWIADDSDERERGLMFVTSEQIAPLPDGTKRGMIFVFDYEQYLSFWMKNTIIPLDIAYVDSQGTVVSIHTMAPLESRPGLYPSDKPARFAIEVQADLLTQLDLKPGDTLDIPPSLLKRSD